MLLAAGAPSFALRTFTSHARASAKTRRESVRSVDSIDRACLRSPIERRNRQHSECRAKERKRGREGCIGAKGGYADADDDDDDDHDGDDEDDEDEDDRIDEGKVASSVCCGSRRRDRAKSDVPARRGIFYVSRIASRRVRDSVLPCFVVYVHACKYKLHTRTRIRRQCESRVTVSRGLLIGNRGSEIAKSNPRSRERSNL